MEQSIKFKTKRQPSIFKVHEIIKFFWNRLDINVIMY